MGTNRNTVILLGILLLLLAVAYPYLTRNDAPEEAAMPVGSGDRSAILQQVNSIKLDMTIVQNKMFQSLKSYSLPPLNIPAGKPNPFVNAAR